MRFLLVALLCALSYAQTGYDNLYLDFFTPGDTDCINPLPIFPEATKANRFKVASLQYDVCNVATTPFVTAVGLIPRKSGGSVTLEWFQTADCTNPIVCEIDCSGLGYVIRGDVGECYTIDPSDPQLKFVVEFDEHPAVLEFQQFSHADNQCATPLDMQDWEWEWPFTWEAFTVGECVFSVAFGLDYSFKVECAERQNFGDDSSFVITLFPDAQCTEDPFWPTEQMEECVPGDSAPNYHLKMLIHGDAVCECKAQENSKWSDAKCRNRCNTGVRVTNLENRCEKHCTVGCADVEMADDNCVSIGDWPEWKCRKKCHFPDAHPASPAWGSCDAQCSGCKLNTQARRSLESNNSFQNRESRMTPEAKAAIEKMKQRLHQ